MKIPTWWGRWKKTDSSLSPHVNDATFHFTTPSRSTITLFIANRTELRKFFPKLWLHGITYVVVSSWHPVCGHETVRMWENSKVLSFRSRNEKFTLVLSGISSTRPWTRHATALSRHLYHSFIYSFKKKWYCFKICFIEESMWHSRCRWWLRETFAYTQNHVVEIHLPPTGT